MLEPDDWSWDDGIGFLPFTKERIVKYDKAYFEKYVGYAQTDQGKSINLMRMGMVSSWITDLPQTTILDVGIGCGMFVQGMRSFGYKCYGTDVNPQGVKWLQKKGWILPHTTPANVLTFWDVLEHIEEPRLLFNYHIPEWVFVCMPIYRDENHVFQSKHYRPGEHCWYFTEYGIRRFMLSHGYDCVEMNQKETILGGREDIYSFAFKKI
jgi:hypothetical protein